MFDFYHEIEQGKEALVSINTILSNQKHAKSTLFSLKSAKELPFSEVLSSKTIQANLENLDYRDRVFSPDVTLWAWLSQVLNEDQSLQCAVARVLSFFISQGRKVFSLNTAGYSQARTRLPEELCSKLTRDSAEQLEQDTPPDWRWRKRAIQLIDGSTVSMADTQENQKMYPQQRCQKPGIGFPMARIVGIISCATGAVLNLAIGPCLGKGSGEHALLRKILDTFKPGDIVIADKYYPSFFLIALLKKMGVDCVFPNHFARGCDFRRGMRLGKKEHIVRWKKPLRPSWMSLEEYNEFAEELEIRESSVQSGGNGFCMETKVIVTTFLDHKEVSKEELGRLYNFRWLVELDLRSIKTTMRMDVLRGKSPEMVQKEIWVRLLAYNLVRKIMAQAAILHNRKPRELSFKLTLQITEAFRSAGIFDKAEYYLELLKLITYKEVGNRPGRHEPRRTKRRAKPYPLLLKPRHFYHKRAA